MCDTITETSKLEGSGRSLRVNTFRLARASFRLACDTAGTDRNATTELNSFIYITILTFNVLLMAENTSFSSAPPALIVNGSFGRLTTK